MDGHELREAILREVSSDGPPYELEVYYDGQGDVFFKGGWPHLAEDYDLHQGWILLFNYHCGTAKFDVKILDGTECHGFINRSAIGVAVWRFVEGGEHGGAIRDGGRTSLPSFRSCNGGETLRAAIINYMATSARL
jgi:hypothetical protein